MREKMVRLEVENEKLVSAIAANAPSSSVQAPVRERLLYGHPHRSCSGPR